MVDIQLLLDILTCYNVSNYGTQSKPLFKATDIGDILEIKRIRKTINLFGDDLRISTLLPTKSGQRYCYALTSLGVYTVLSVTRKSKCIEILNKLNIHKPDYKPFSLQTSFSNNIKKAFYGETIYEEFVIDKYRIDLFFPDYNLAIEYDEEFHSSYKQDDLKRMKYITSKLGCVFIRHSYLDSYLDCINKIFKHIMLTRDVGYV
jgi:hypothetical protein